MMHNGNHQQDVVLEQKTPPVQHILIVEPTLTLKLKNTFTGTALKKQKPTILNLLKLLTAHVKLLKVMDI